MKKGLLTVVIIIGLVWFFSSIFKKDKYIGFYYPDASNLSSDIQSDGFFDSLKQCRVWVNIQISEYNKDTHNYDYECGKNCSLQNGQKSDLNSEKHWKLSRKFFTNNDRTTHQNHSKGKKKIIK